MGLAQFPLLVRRWRRSTLYYSDYAKYSQLREYLPEDIFLSRVTTINRHVYREYPHVWIDTYAFLLAVTFVIATAAFSVIARAVDLSMWYPLILLSVPALVAFFTTRRRNSYYRRLSDYYDSLQSCLKELNSLDVTRQIKWDFRRVRESDTSASMHLKGRLARYNINCVIEVVQINIENELAQEGEVLPAYDASARDTVLAIGPEIEQAPGNRSSYMTQGPGNGFPPPYQHEIIEMDSVQQPPPAYLTEEAVRAPPNTISSSADLT
ncbi:uncharacterized protein B0P05DRAFT_551651 [Gilbertella persicaria]|uniref:Uncharacterized protein n=1 Tax=Rhizopus stolonifer TaxID=4846 RepID=A0A367KUX1_RHIST|nr:uncharacterized protein B0P05DRAFT_551651 [Gilbertella persicaria]KAI8069128.1 hypothetical protein B0P05DRAFT_551651 [Gilbertella persicaria]RCI05957.1 hypothetical protein CU098_013178 [Rhizopus stolonifer]